ncbi:MAG TPA: hypothetical protein VFF30_01515 [Nitrososphaerales archaeon]|nr:hypothetical protein [Nitrososphaerales archaeon]
MHSLVTDWQGTNGEFQISLRAFLLTDDASREAAVRLFPYKPNDRYILFEFKIDRCLTNYYVDGLPHASSWKE